ncbi:peptidylprolyl isomerase [Streptococcus halichoeri]|uniref:peptidylprolyl isomerase n=1 Tax=Streptococcus halichoeri TaxID=254785 RepID=UPI001C8DEBD0|nr:peptidylprolyl isomerase [Streptococcus halichoeri]
MKKIISLTLVLVSLTGLFGCESLNRAIKGDKYVDDKITKASSDKASSQYEKEIKKALKADQSAFPQLNTTVDKDEAKVILKTSQGDMTLKLFPKQAPLAVENFLTHAKEGYYNGLTFHRVIADFMIQSGDPNGDGTGGESIWKDKKEAIDSGRGFANEISPFLYNLRGALAMANAGADTNGSQFYINQNKKDQSKELAAKNYPKPIIKAYQSGGNPSLDGGYTVFGQVIEGMDVVDKIATSPVDKNDKPKNKITITSIDIIKDYQFKN